VVPKSFKGGESSAQIALIYWFFGYFAWAYMNMFRPPKIVEADAVHVLAPLRVAARYHAKVRRMSEGRLKKLLRTVPAYAQLLDENDLSRVSAAGRVDPE
jgi:hypothetical protein